jgi:PAS domain S-box-containing protein
MGVQKAAVVLVPLILFAALGWWTWRGVEAAAYERAERVSAALAAHMHRVLLVQETMLNSALGGVRGRTPEDIERDRGLHEFLEHLALGISISLSLAQEDRVLAASQEPPPEAIHAARETVKAQGYGTHLGHWVNDAGKTLITISQSGPDSGVIALSLVPPDDFLMFYEGLRSAGRDALTLARADGIPLIGFPGGDDPVGLPLPPDSPFMRAIQTGSKLSGIAPGPSDGLERVWGIEKVEGYPIYALYGLDAAIMWADWLRRMLPVGLLALLGSGALLLLTSRLQQTAMEAEAARAEARAQEDLRWNAKRNELLSGIAARLLRTSDPKAEIEDLCRNVMEFLGCDACFTDYTVDGCAARLDLNSCAGAEVTGRLHYGAVICGCARDDGPGAASEDIPDIAALQIKWVKPGGTGVYCCHPLFVGNRVIGTLSFGSQSRRVFSAAEIDVMQSVSHLVSMALNRMQAEAAVGASEARFRGIFEHAATGIAIADLEGRFQACNPAFSAMLGYATEELRGLTFIDVTHAEDCEKNMSEVARLLAQEISSFESLSRCVGKGGGLLWGDSHVSLLTDGAGSPAGIIVLVTDMTEHKRHEEQINLLMAEVNHRAKNMLTVVHSIARQTAARKPDDFIERFGERIQALAASQDLLVKNDWRGVDLDELVRSQLAHFRDLIGARIDLKGPQIMISASAAQTIGMALHELATNAGKYGALSNGEGRVEVGWGLECDGSGQGTFAMSWRETGGPQVTAPEMRGFGSAIISSVAESSLCAKVELGFPASGLSWRLHCPAGEVMDISDLQQRS